MLEEYEFEPKSWRGCLDAEGINIAIRSCVE